MLQRSLEGLALQQELSTSLGFRAKQWWCHRMNARGAIVANIPTVSEGKEF